MADLADRKGGALHLGRPKELPRRLGISAGVPNWRIIVPIHVGPWLGKAFSLSSRANSAPKDGADYWHTGELSIAAGRPDELFATSSLHVSLPESGNDLTIISVYQSERNAQYHNAAGKRRDSLPA